MAETVGKLVWDKTGERYFEMGTSKGVLYPMTSTGKYGTGVAWNGLTGVTESPSGAEATDMYADDIKYASIRSAETFGATIEAYTYPKEFEPCNGSIEIAPGVYIGQQTRTAFGFAYVTQIGNDTATDADDAYKIHLVYGATASPSEKAYTTINDSPEGVTFSWEISTTPVNVTGHKPTATLVIDTRTADEEKVKALEDILYGKDAVSGEPSTPGVAARLPLPDEVYALFSEE